MIYELQITDTYYVMQYSTLTCTHEVLKKEAFTFEGTEYQKAVDRLKEYVGSSIIIDNTAKIGVQIVVINKITGATVFQSDNYVFKDDNFKDIVLSRITDNDISKPKDYSKMVGWGTATLVVFCLLLSFKACKNGLDEDRRLENSVKESEIIARRSGIDTREINDALAGKDTKTEEEEGRVEEDTETRKEIASKKLPERHLTAKQKEAREYLKNIYGSQPDPYHDKNGRTRSIAGPGVHNYTEYEIKGDTLVLYSARFRESSEFSFAIKHMTKIFVECGFKYIKGHSHEKRFYGDTPNGWHAKLYNKRYYYKLYDRGERKYLWFQIHLPEEEGAPTIYFENLPE